MNSGSWYRISRDFVSTVNDDIETIPETEIAFPDYCKEEEEGAYNERLSKQICGARLMDRKNIAYGGGKSSIEFCDVLTKDKQLVHVKRYRGSAVL